MEVVEEVPVRADPPDIGAWVQARGAALQRFAYLVTGDADGAGDLVQEALSRALPRWRELAASDTAEAYVRRSIVNASISGWRKNRRLVTVADPEPHVREHEPDPSVAAADADHAWALVQTLPCQQRAAVVLRFYEDLSFDQIAVILDCPSSTARSHVHRAMTALRARLDEENADD